jgi:hypothetical protein
MRHPITYLFLVAASLLITALSATALAAIAVDPTMKATVGLSSAVGDDGLPVSTLIWNLDCVNATGAPRYSWARIELVYAATGAIFGTSVGNATLVPEPGGSTTVSSVAGANVFPRLVDAECYDGTAGSDRKTVEGGAVQVPPGIRIAQIANPDGAELKGDLATGQQFRVFLSVYANPVASEKVMIHVEELNTIDYVDELNAFMADLPVFTAYRPGSIAIWAELVPGAKSKKLYTNVLGSPKPKVDNPRGRARRTGV